VNRNEILLKQTMANVFRIKPEDVTEESTMDNLEQWDSLKHLNLVLALEQAFDVTMSEEQALEILSYQLVKAVLSELGVRFSDAK
jgi:acyl carrier protein